MRVRPIGYNIRVSDERLHSSAKIKLHFRHVGALACTSYYAYVNVMFYQESCQKSEAYEGDTRNRNYSYCISRIGFRHRQQNETPDLQKYQQFFFIIKKNTHFLSSLHFCFNFTFCKCFICSKLWIVQFQTDDESLKFNVVHFWFDFSQVRQIEKKINNPKLNWKRNVYLFRSLNSSVLNWWWKFEIQYCLFFIRFFAGSKKPGKIVNQNGKLKNFFVAYFSFLLASSPINPRPYD